MDPPLHPNLLPLPIGDTLQPHEAQRLRREIQDLDKAIAQLTEQRDLRLSLLSPLRQIPLEVLGEVFSIVLGEHLITPSTEGMKQLLDLGLVCKRWQEAARVNRHLWATVKLVSPITPQRCSRAAEWLNRSKFIPKTLFIDSTPDCSGSCRRQSEDRCALDSSMLAALLTVGPSPLRRLWINCTRSLCFENLQRRLSEAVYKHIKPRPWDTVQSLVLYNQEFWNHYDEATDDMYDEENSDYPLLETLPQSITSFNLHIPMLDENEGAEEDSPYIFKIPNSLLNRLTRLTFSCSMNSSTILRILASCTRVESLCLDLNWNGWSSPDEGGLRLDADANSLPALRHLRIVDGSFDTGAIEYLRAFRSPLLQTLELSSTEFGNDIDGSSFASYVESFLDRSQCQSTLTHLRIHRAPIDGLFIVLSQLSSLTNLELSAMGSCPRNLFQTLLVHQKRDQLLPSLTSLSLLDVPDELTLQGYLGSWIEERRRSGMGNMDVTVTHRCERVREVRRGIYNRGQNEDLTNRENPHWSKDRCEQYQRERWDVDEFFA
ncbi:hypothetical protein NMY22_g18488 [Coprinellus aureogranulatus]|nr:hypothetical protein NMY22_g18488 [Coprinellus aureogranulatus]